MSIHASPAHAPLRSLAAAWAILCCGSFSVQAILVSETAPPEGIHVVASSVFSPQQDPRNLVESAGMSGVTHDNEDSARTMWHTKEQPAPSVPAAGLPAAPAWVRFDFNQAEPIDEIQIWNHNQAAFTDRGFCKAILYTSDDGINWTAKSIEIPRASGRPDEPVSLVIKIDGKPVKSVILAANSNYGGSCYGLSHLDFVRIHDVPEAQLPLPKEMECAVQPFYGHRADGKAGRVTLLKMNGALLYGDASATVYYEGGRETTQYHDLQGASELKLLLPEGVGVRTETPVRISLQMHGKTFETWVSVPAKRQWTVYIFPHSHVDIGYTNTQANVETIHERNLMEGIKLAKETLNYPDGARYVWNNEVAWPVERYLSKATPAEREEMLDAIRKGYISVNAGYTNENTSAFADEEFPGFFRPSQEIAKLTGVKIDTIVQVDVPGMSWGVVPAAAQAGVRYCMALNNGSDRTGRSMELSYHPFWWLGPDGRTKILFLEPGSYAVGAHLKGMSMALSILGQTDMSKVLTIYKTGNPRAHFIDGYLWPTLDQLEKSDYYPYDIFALSWSMADNTPMDGDLPDAVKSWNEEYAYPHLVIATADQIMSTFEQKYGDQLPTYHGDFTEYWTDGLGTAAKQTAMNRASSERLIQAETLWSMLHSGQAAPQGDFDEAWRYVLLGSEHTWAFANPAAPISDQILKIKFGYFQTAEDRSKALLASALQSATGTGSATIGVFNTLSWKRSGLVTLPAEQSQAGDLVVDETGRAVPSQRLSAGELAFLAMDVPAMGARKYRVTTGQSPSLGSAGCRINGTKLSNGLATVTIDPNNGDIVTLTDKTGYDYVNSKAPCALNSFRYLHGGDSQEKATGPKDVKVTVKENGPLVVSLVAQSGAEGCRSLAREVRLVAGQPQVEMTDLVDKIGITAKEGVHFGFAFNIPDSATRADIPWGVMEVEKDQLPAGNRNWIAFQRWLDVSNNGHGVTWCSLDAPTFEYGGITANIIGAAIGSPAWITRLQPSSTIYSWALNNHWHTNFPLSQEGLLHFRYRVLPHANGYDAVAADRFGREQAQPLIAAPVREGFREPEPIAIDNPRVVVTNMESTDAGKATLVSLRSLSSEAESIKITLSAGASATTTLLPYGCSVLRVETR